MIRVSRLQATSVLVCFAVVGLLAPGSAVAQRVGGGGGGASSRKPPKQQQQPPSQPIQPRKDLSHGNNELIEVIKFVPAKEGAENAGVLTAKVVDPGTVIQLDLGADVTLDFNGKSIKSDQFVDLFQRGLWLAATWDTAKEKSRTIKRISTMSLTPFEVEGEMAKVDEKKEKNKEIVVLRVTPKDQKNWPDEEEMVRRQPSHKAPPVRPRNIKCRTIEDASKVTDESGQPITLFDLQPEQKLQGKVLYCGKLAVLVMEMTVVSPDGKKPDQPRERQQEPSRPGRPPRLRLGPGG